MLLEQDLHPSRLGPALEVALAAALAFPLLEHDPAQMRHLDCDPDANRGEKLRVAHHTNRIAVGAPRRNGPTGLSFRAARPTLAVSLSTLRRVAKVAHQPPPLEWETPLYAQASAQLERALELADVSDLVSTRLRSPERAVILTVPVRMDDGTYRTLDRKSTRLNSSHANISYAVFCLK